MLVANSASVSDGKWREHIAKPELIVLNNCYPPLMITQRYMIMQRLSTCLQDRVS